MRKEPLYLRGRIWWCRVRDEYGRIERRSTKCRDYTAAQKAWRSFERLAADPSYAAASKTSLAEAITAYFAELKRRGVSKATMDVAQQKCGHLVRIWGPSMPIVEIDADLVSAYIAQREGEKVTDNRFTQPLTIKKELGALKGTLDVARHQGRFHRDVVTVMPLRYSGRHKPRTRYLSPEELRLLLSALPAWRSAHLAFFVATGARLAEAKAARRSDVTDTVVYLRGTKTEGSRGTVPITPLTRELLDWSLANAPGKDVLFRPWGKLHRDVKAACARAGIEKAGPNDLRRTFGKWHRLAGILPADIAVLLRHTTDKLAQTTYAKVDGEELAPILQAKLRAVPVLCISNTRNEENKVHPEDINSEKVAPPGRLERPTNGLGIRYTGDARSVGTRLGLSRYRVQQKSQNVPVLNDDVSWEKSSSDDDEPPMLGVSRWSTCRASCRREAA